MIKNFDTKANELLSTVIDSIETTLQCSKYKQISDRIEVCLPDNASFKSHENKKLASKGFGTCLLRSYNLGFSEICIIIDMENCTQANLTDREIGAVIFHELGHILNEPELEDEPTFEYCFINGLHYRREILEEVRESNCITMEIFADSYANKHGFGQYLISTFYKQNHCFEQKIEYCSIRIKNIEDNKYLEGKILSLHRNGR